MKKIVLFILFTQAVILLSAQSSIERQYEHADGLFENKLYFDSITEFKRLLFFDNENKYVYEANYKIGEAYKHGAFFDNAIKYFTTAKMNTESTDQIFQAEIQIVRCNILRKTTDRALELLNELENNNDFRSYRKEINYWKGWTYIFEDEWEKAANIFTDEPELQQLCKQVAEDKYSVTFASVISYILPGAGQIYTGNYFSGFMSLAWNVLWGYLTIDAFIEDRAFDGIATGSLLWLRFYRGNVQNAEKHAEIENVKIANKALLHLQYNYKGIKP